MRVIVTGGRGFADSEWLCEELDKLTITTLVHGGCPTGADRFADDYGSLRGIRVKRFAARWGLLGRAAGPIRNKEMARAGADLCLAFPGGSGTESCVRECEKAGIEVRRLAPA